MHGGGARDQGLAECMGGGARNQGLAECIGGRVWLSAWGAGQGLAECMGVRVWPSAWEAGFGCAQPGGGACTHALTRSTTFPSCLPLTQPRPPTHPLAPAPQVASFRRMQSQQEAHMMNYRLSNIPDTGAEGLVRLAPGKSPEPEGGAEGLMRLVPGKSLSHHGRISGQSVSTCVCLLLWLPTCLTD